MSYTRDFFENPFVLQLNYNSGYFAAPTAEENYGPFEDDIHQNMSVFGGAIDYRYGYAYPLPRFFYEEAGLAAPTASEKYARIFTVIVPVSYPDINSQGYFRTTPADDLPYQAMFKAGFQRAITEYTSGDTYLGHVERTNEKVTGAFFGMPEKMQDVVTFYTDTDTNGYYNCPFVSFKEQTCMAATTNEDGDLIQVAYSGQISLLNNRDNQLYVDAGLCVDNESFVPPVDNDIAYNKYVPYFAELDNSDRSSVPTTFETSLNYYPSTNSHIIKDLRQRFGLREEIKIESEAYVKNKISDISSLIDSVISMPKEFRIRMQTSTPYDLTKITTMPMMNTTMESTAPSTPSPSTSGASSMGSMGGGMGGGGTGGTGY